MSGTQLDTVDGSAIPVGDRRDAGESWRSVAGSRLLVAALVAWLWSLIGVDLREMTDVGLLSVLPNSFVLGLAVLSVGFAVVIENGARRRLLVAGYLVLLSAMAHATPALLGGQARNPWSYEHLGMVEHIQRTGTVDHAAVFTQVHHAWPGVFGATAMLSDVSGIDPATIAVWTPFVSTLLSLLALSVVFRCFADDERIVALGLFLFVVGNWVGQEYFAPQGFGFVLYLALLAIAVPLDRRRQSEPGRFELLDGGDLEPVRGGRYGWMSSVVVVIVLAIAVSHLLTTIMVLVTFAIVAASRVSRTAWVSVEAAGMLLVWGSLPALTYLRDRWLAAADLLGLPAEPGSTSLLDGAQVSTGQAIVVVAGRFLSQAIIVLAVIGIVVWSRRRSGSTLVAVLAASPLVLLVIDVSLEMLWRSYLFAVPWLALAAAIALTSMTDGWSFAARVGARSAVTGLLLIAFVVASLGQERVDQYTSEEVELTTWLAATAPPGTLLVEGSRSYPGRSGHAENFVYLPLPGGSDAALAQLTTDPEEYVFGRMTDPQYADSYLIVTRSMRNEQEDVPSLPAGMLDRLETAIRASDRFEVVRSNRDGTIWIAVGEGS